MVEASVPSRRPPHPAFGHLLPEGRRGGVALMPRFGAFAWSDAAVPSPLGEKVAEGRMRGRFHPTLAWIAP